VLLINIYYQVIANHFAIKLECYNLKNVREKYFTCSSLKEVFENVDATSIIAFIKEINFYAPQLCRQALLRRVLAMGILSVCLSVCPSRPGTDSMPGEIETPGLHHMIA